MRRKRWPSDSCEIQKEPDGRFFSKYQKQEVPKMSLFECTNSTMTIYLCCIDISHHQLFMFLLSVTKTSSVKETIFSCITFLDPVLCYIPFLAHAGFTTSRLTRTIYRSKKISLFWFQAVVLSTASVHTRSTSFHSTVLHPSKDAKCHIHSTKIATVPTIHKLSQKQDLNHSQAV